MFNTIQCSAPSADGIHRSSRAGRLTCTVRRCAKYFWGAEAQYYLALFSATASVGGGNASQDPVLDREMSPRRAGPVILVFPKSAIRARRSRVTLSASRGVAIRPGRGNTTSVCRRFSQDDWFSFVTHQYRLLVVLLRQLRLRAKEPPMHSSKFDRYSGPPLVVVHVCRH